MDFAASPMLSAVIFLFVRQCEESHCQDNNICLVEMKTAAPAWPGHGYKALPGRKIFRAAQGPWPDFLSKQQEAEMMVRRERKPECLV